MQLNVILIQKQIVIIKYFTISMRLLALILLFLSIHGTRCILGMLGIPPQQVFVTDIDHQVLVNDVAPILKTTYLSVFQEKIKTQYQGIIYGPGMRALVNMPLGFMYKSCPIIINVIFKVDIGSPITTLSREVLQKLFDNCPQIQRIFTGSYSVKIADHQIKVQESKAHYKALNILGADFMSQMNTRLEINYSRRKLGQFKLLIQGSWVTDQAEESQMIRI